MRDIIKEDFEKRNSKKVDNTSVSSIPSIEVSKLEREQLRKEMETRKLLQTDLEKILNYDPEINNELLYNNYGTFIGPLSFWLENENEETLLEKIEQFNKDNPENSIDISDTFFAQKIKLFCKKKEEDISILQRENLSWETVVQYFLPSYDSMMRERKKMGYEREGDTYDKTYLTNLLLFQEMQDWEIYKTMPIPLGIRERIDLDIEDILIRYKKLLSLGVQEWDEMNGYYSRRQFLLLNGYLSGKKESLKTILKKKGETKEEKDMIIFFLSHPNAMIKETWKEYLGTDKQLNISIDGKNTKENLLFISYLQFVIFGQNYEEIDGKVGEKTISGWKKLGKK